MTFLFNKRVFFPAALLLLLAGCIGTGDDEAVPAPKPRAYYRLSFPEKKYRLYEGDCPFSFEIPVYSTVEHDRAKNAEPCWLNIIYPLYKAQLHLSYKEVNNNLRDYLEQSRELAMKHQVKASGLDQEVVIHDSAHVYGLIYDIAGNSASAVQFYITDSTRHFMRGSLYFNAPPNIDSMKIVIDYLRKDIMHMIESFKWKENTASLAGKNH